MAVHILLPDLQLSDLAQEGGRGSAQPSVQQVSALWWQPKCSYPSHGQYRPVKCLVSSGTGVKNLTAGWKCFCQICFD